MAIPENRTMSNITLYVDSTEHNEPLHLFAKQFDSKSRYIVVRILDSHGLINIKGEYRLNATKPDDTHEYIKGTIDNEGNITFEMTANLLSVEGLVSCDISIESSDQGQYVLLTTHTFYIDVGKSNYDLDATESADSILDINGARLTDNSITTDKLSNGAVTAEKLADENIFMPAQIKIFNGVLGEGESVLHTASLLDGANLKNGSVTGEKIADDSVTEDKLAEESVTESKLSQALYNLLQRLKEKAFIDISYDAASGVLTFRTTGGQTVDVDFPLELIVEGGRYDETSQNLVLVLANGDEITIPFNDAFSKVMSEYVKASSKANSVYAVDAYGEPQMYPLSKGPINDTIAARYGDGSLRVAAPSTADGAVNRQYLEETLENLKYVPSHAGMKQYVYLIDNDGVNSIMKYGSGVVANSFAVRRSSGQLMVGTPTDNNDATTKKYVDNAIAPIKRNVVDVPNKQIVETLQIPHYSKIAVLGDDGNITLETNSSFDTYIMNGGNLINDVAYYFNVTRVNGNDFSPCYVLEYTKNGWVQKSFNENGNCPFVWNPTEMSGGSWYIVVPIDATVKLMSGTEDMPRGQTIVLANNTEYRISGTGEVPIRVDYDNGVLESVNCDILMSSTNVALNFLYSTQTKWRGEDVTDGVFVPVEKKRYKLSFMWDGEYMTAKSEVLYTL